MGQGPEFWRGEEGTNFRAMLAGTFEKTNHREGISPLKVRGIERRISCRIFECFS